MGTFFDATDPADQKLLSEDNRNDSELETVADQAEYDVIRRYEVYDDVGERVEVALAGYDEDTDTADSTALAEALRRTIALVVDTRLTHRGDDRALESKSHGSRSWDYNVDELGRKWPDGWRQYLQDFDRLERPYHL